MAKAEMKLTDYTLNLTLNQNEAETLLIILGKIGGTPTTTRRRFADAMRKALNTAGVGIVIAKTNSSAHDSIYFDDEVVNG
jgi:type II secretory pathway predicted ATPase ExeA